MLGMRAKKILHRKSLSRMVLVRRSHVLRVQSAIGHGVGVAALPVVVHTTVVCTCYLSFIFMIIVDFSPPERLFIPKGRPRSKVQISHSIFSPRTHPYSPVLITHAQLKLPGISSATRRNADGWTQTTGTDDGVRYIVMVDSWL